MVALAQPFYLNMPAKISSAWFAVKERDLSTTVCSLANPLGSAIGSLIPAFFVTGGGVTGNDDEDVSGVASLLLVQLAIALLTLFLVIILFDSDPPTPPSNTASIQTIADQVGTRSVKDEFYQLLGNGEYVKLLISFTIVLGNLNALAALLNQLPGNYSDSEIGVTGFALILSGFAGAFIAGIILEKSKAYRPILKTVWVCGAAAWAVFMISCRSDNSTFFILSAAMLGFFLLPISKSFRSLVLSFVVLTTLI